MLADGNVKCHGGLEVVEKQASLGARPLLEDIDLARMTYGNSRVHVLTPKVETRLRSGLLAQIPLKVEIDVSPEHRVSMVFELHIGYPEIPASFEVFGKGCCISNNSIGSDQLPSEDSSYCSQLMDLLTRTVASSTALTIMDIIDFAKAEVSRNPPILSDVSDQIVTVRTGDDDAHDVHNEENEGDDDNDDEEEGAEEGIDQDDSNDELNEEEEKAELLQSLTATRIAALAKLRVSAVACKQCRLTLFPISSCDDHTITSNLLNTIGSSKCTSIFLLEAPEWVDTSSTISGKINCPNSHCGARLGQWSWSGSPCSCGKWIVPAFQVNISKVDFK